MARPIKNALETYGRVRITLKEGGSAKRFRVLWTDASGRQRERTATTLEAARTIAVTTSQQLEDPHAPIQPDATFGALLDRWLDKTARGWNDERFGNMDTYSRNHIIPTLGDRRCDLLRDTDLTAVLDDMNDEGYAKETIARVRWMLGRLGRYGVRQGVWSAMRDPAAELAMPADANGSVGLHLIDRRRQVPTRAQVEDFCATLDAKRPEYGLMGRLAASTGLRWGELIALRPPDIDLAACDIEVTKSISEWAGKLREKTPKTQAGFRVVSFEEHLREPLRAHLAAIDNSDYVFTGARGGIWRRSNFRRRVWGPARSGSSYPNHMVWHSLRHYAITSLLDDGVEVRDVSEWAGHSSTDVTWKRYVGADDQSRDRIKKAQRKRRRR